MSMLSRENEAECKSAFNGAPVFEASLSRQLRWPGSEKQSRTIAPQTASMFFSYSRSTGCTVMPPNVRDELRQPATDAALA
jgi:hypothetical protein